VEQPEYEQYRQAPNEQEIWVRHNPEAFSTR